MPRSHEDAVAGTGLLVAAIRARESARADRLFTDPFADKLAGAAGHRMLNAALAEAGEQSVAEIVVRTRFHDDALLRVTRQVKQVVILAAGMDARAYRIAWPVGTTVFELDQPEVIDAKADLLDRDEATCRRVAIGVDLADDWPTTLVAAGFDVRLPSVWVVEGLLQYLDEPAVRQLFARIDAVSAPDSVVLYDAVGKVLLESPFMASVLTAMAEQGSPWLFGTDEPGDLAAGLGWTADVTDVAVPGNAWGRWFAPAVPLDVPGVPRGYFVEATK
jgi:methyltransferase (TIGR00027 family)